MNHSGHCFLIVLYNQKLSTSPAYQSLKPQLLTGDNLIVYDNSPVSMLDVKAENFVYFHDVTNTGLATAYNFAVQKCRETGHQWLTIFDQDTRIPTGFNHDVTEAITSSNAITVLVPQVTLEDGTSLSPFWIEDALFVHYPAKDQKTLAAINSGMTLNLATFSTDEELFDDRYPLDFLDYVFFKRLQTENKRVAQLPITLIQSLSLSDFRTMSQKRFESFQFAESRFVTEFYPQLINQYHLRVMLRLAKQLLKRVQWPKLKVMLQVVGGKTS